MASAPTFSSIDLSRLPPPDVVEQIDFEAVFTELKASLITIWPEFDALLESEPLVKLLQVAAWRELLLRQRVNEASRAVMLAYATGADLDQLAALMGVTRIEITPADEGAGSPAVMESDIELRERVILAPESFSVAGPVLAYVFHARSAHPLVLDASVLSPEPGEVLVTVLSREGTGEPAPDVIEAVEDRVNGRNVRPLTDLVTVQGAQIIEYSIDAEIFVFEGPDPAVVIAASQSRVEAYVERERRLGRDITRSAIFAALHVEGVQRVELAQPAADVVLSPTQAGHCALIALDFAGHAD